MISLGEDEVRTRTDNFVLRTRKVLGRTKSVIEPLRIDPDGGVFDLQTGTGARAFVVARQDRTAIAMHLTGFGIDLGLGAKAHAVDDQIAETGAHNRQTERATIPQEFDLTLGRQNTNAVPDCVFAAKACLVLESLTKLGGGVEAPRCSLLKEDVQDDVRLAKPLGVEPGTRLLAHKALVHRVQFDPSAVGLVDELSGQCRTISQLDFQPADGAVLVGPVHEQPGRVKATQRAGTGQGKEWIVLDLLLGRLAGVVGEDDASIRIDGLAQDLSLESICRTELPVL